MEHSAMIESISAITLATHDMSRSVDTISTFSSSHNPAKPRYFETPSGCHLWPLIIKMDVSPPFYDFGKALAILL
jgi:hypothetical protein